MIRTPKPVHNQSERPNKPDTQLLNKFYSTYLLKIKMEKQFRLVIERNIILHVCICIIFYFFTSCEEVDWSYN